MTDVTYINVNFSGSGSTTIARVDPAEETISRSGTIIDDASDYYVAVVRLKFSTNNPLIIMPCTSAQFAADGITTDWSLTVRQTVDTLGPATRTEFFGRAFLKLRRQDPILGQTTQPKDLYTAVWSPEEWVRILNTAAEEAYAACIAAGATLGATDIPFFSLIPGTGRLELTVYPFTQWEQGQRPVPMPDPPVAVSTRNDLLSNWSMQTALGGFGFRAETFPNQPLNANGADYRFLILSDGSNYLPANAPAAHSLTPTAAPAALIIPQSFPTQKMPGIVKIAVVTSLPTMQEFIPSDSGKGSRAVLTDFAPDPSNSMIGECQTTEIYNADIGNARWIKLKGGGPISTFSVRVETEDWLGQIRTLGLTGEYESFDMKLCFAPKRVVDNYAQKHA